MRFVPPSSKRTRDIAIIPLINVVFLILIFFVIAGQIAQSDLFEIDLPESVSTSVPGTEIHTLVVNKDGKMALNQHAIELSLLLSKIRGSSTSTEIDKAKIKLLVKADSELLVSELQPMLSILREAGFRRVSIATLEKSQ